MGLWHELVGVRTYKTKYYAEITHKGLNDYKVFTSYEQSILQSKVNAHVAKLKEKWDNVVSKQNLIKSKDQIQKEAELLTLGAVKALKEIDEILLYTLDINDVIDWDSLKDYTKFDIQSPKNQLNNLLNKVLKPAEPVLIIYPDKPNPIDFEPKFSFFDHIFTANKIKKIEKSESDFTSAYEKWESDCKKVDEDNDKLKLQFQIASEDYQKKLDIIIEQNTKDTKKWEQNQEDFYNKQKQNNQKIDNLKASYFNLDPNAVVEYCNLVLENSKYPDTFPKSFEIEYNPDSKILIVDYSLPSFEHIPTLSEVKVIKGELKNLFISDSQRNKMFEATMYNITLRTIHELFEADVVEAIDAVSFNGWVRNINKATGKTENNCIMSIQTKRSEFMNIDLRHVDPKTCFKNLKGVGSSKLSGITPIQPIITINRSDKRFVDHYDVADSIDNSVNLASMDWEDFENLIREIFGKEFSSNGGEVKVTQASRDGGVDAIAFDPDPIRGGKIVIQAKRYTNTVGVSAVRDLFGTVLNEGATKGILVTTSDYGSDAYNFAKGKPLTLMNGSHLLYLLEKHGHQARINIREARDNMTTNRTNY